jgi:hypothetical protein
MRKTAAIWASALRPEEPPRSPHCFGACEAFRVPIGQLLRGLPSRLPFARAFRSPARTRSRISARSNSHHRSDNLKHQPAVRGTEIQIIPQTDEGYSENCEFSEGIDQMFQGPSTAVDSVANGTPLLVRASIRSLRSYPPEAASRGRADPRARRTHGWRRYWDGRAQRPPALRVRSAAAPSDHAFWTQPVRLKFVRRKRRSLPR